MSDHHINPDNDLNVIVRRERGDHRTSVLAAIDKACEQWKRSPFVYIDMSHQVEGRFELSELLHGTMKGLHLFNLWNVVCQQEIQYCPMLTHLLFNGVYSKDVFERLSDALQKSKFPRLSHLSLANCSLCKPGKDFRLCFSQSVVLWSI